MDASQRFSLAPKILELGFSALRSLGISEVVAGPLQDIADMCMGASNIGELDGTDVIMIARRTARMQKARFYSLNIHVGTRLPALYTATGRALLGFAPDTLDAALRRCEMDRTGGTSVVSKDELKTRVQQGLAQGAVRIRDELAPGFGAVAIAVPISEDRTIALSGSYLLADHGPDIEDRVEEMLREHAPTVASLMRTHSELPSSKN